MTESGEKIIKVLRGSMRRLTAAVVILILVVVGMMVFGYFFIKSTNDALCDFKTDLERRVAQSQQFIQDHPEGFAGISVEELRLSIENQQRTINSLSSLHCN